MLLPAVPAVVQAQFTFTINNGSVTIAKYTGSENSVTIPSTTNGYQVTSIGSSAFLNCSSVTNVTIPNTVTNIDFQAFTYCGLTSVTIPDSVTGIKGSAFMYCSSLASLTIGESVISIGYDVFYGCSSLTNVIIPNSVTNIKSTAFAYCSSLTNITVNPQNPAYSSVAGVLLDKNRTTLIEYPFGLAGSYTIPGSVTNIGEYAFDGCNGLTNLTIPNSVTTIEQYAVSGCASLTNIIIPTSVTTIGQSAFSGCASLTNIIIPNSVTNIGAGVFGYCTHLTGINVDASNPAYCSVAGVLFDFSQTALIEFPYGKSGSYFKPGSYTIPNSVTNIGDWAFSGCLLSNITLPDNLTTIGVGAFGGCTRLSNITIPNGVTTIGDVAFEATSLTSITIPSSVTTLGTLNCPSLLRAYFQGNAPSRGNGNYVIVIPRNTIAYYLPGTTGWVEFNETTDIPTALWLPQIQISKASFGVRTNQFGFNIQWASDKTVMVEACTNLSNPDWQPVQTNILTTGSAYFSDPQWTNYPNHFYRIRSP